MNDASYILDYIHDYIFPYIKLFNNNKQNWSSIYITCYMNFIFHEYIKTLYYRWFHKADSKHWKIWIHENSYTKIINQDYLFIKL